MESSGVDELDYLSYPSTFLPSYLPTFLPTQYRIQWTTLLSSIHFLMMYAMHFKPLFKTQVIPIESVLSIPKWRELHILLDNPDQKPQTQAESRLKYRAFTEFELINNRLYKQPDSKFPNPRYVVPESEVFDIIANQHLQLLYAGRH